jgi:hypothetical protein
MDPEISRAMMRWRSRAAALWGTQRPASSPKKRSTTLVRLNLTIAGKSPAGTNPAAASPAFFQEPYAAAQASFWTKMLPITYIESKDKFLKTHMQKILIFLGPGGA